MTVVINVHDRRHGWIGSWEAERLDPSLLTYDDLGRTVIYDDPHGRREAGTMVQFEISGLPGDVGTVWALYSTGDTAAGAPADHMWLATAPLDGDLTR